MDRVGRIVVLCLAAGGRRFADAARLTGLRAPHPAGRSRFGDADSSAPSSRPARRRRSCWSGPMSRPSPLASRSGATTPHVHPDLDRRDAGRRAGFRRDARLASAAAMAVASRTVALVGTVGWPLVIWWGDRLQPRAARQLPRGEHERRRGASGRCDPAFSTRRSRTSSACCGSTSSTRASEEPSQRFVRFVALPLAISAALSCALSCYQAFVDLTFWSSGGMGAAPPCFGDDARRERVGHGRRVLDGRIRRAGGAWRGRQRAIAAGAGALRRSPPCGRPARGQPCWRPLSAQGSP